MTTENMSKQNPGSPTPPSFNSSVPLPDINTNTELETPIEHELSTWEKILERWKKTNLYKFWKKLSLLEKITFISFFIDAVAMGGISYLGVQAAFQVNGFFSFFGITLTGSLFSSVLIIAAITGGLCFVCTRLLDFSKKINENYEKKLAEENNEIVIISNNNSTANNKSSRTKKIILLASIFICVISAGVSAYIGTYALFSSISVLGIALGAIAAALRALTFAFYNYKIKDYIKAVFSKEPIPSEKNITNELTPTNLEESQLTIPSNSSSVSLSSTSSSNKSSESLNKPSRAKRIFKGLIFLLSGTCKGLGAFFAASILLTPLVGLTASIIIGGIFGLNCTINTVWSRLKKDKQYNESCSESMSSASSISESETDTKPTPWYKRSLLQIVLYSTLTIGIVFDILGSAVSYPGANIKTIEDCLSFFAHSFTLGGLTNPLTITLLSFAVVISLAAIYASWLFTYGPSRKDFETFCADKAPLPLSVEDTTPTINVTQQLSIPGEAPAQQRAATGPALFCAAAKLRTIEASPARARAAQVIQVN